MVVSSPIPHSRPRRRLCAGSLQTEGLRHGATALLQDGLAAPGRAGPLPLPARLPEPQGGAEPLRYPEYGGGGGRRVPP